jgi:subtilase family serine protease
MSFIARIRKLAVGVAGLLAFAAPAPATAPAVLAVHPIPAITGHVSSASLSFPPTTAFCRANLGFSCYQPFQFQRAYNLAPLFDAGIDGRGRTIVIVDAFGSPTIENDLKVFDTTFGLPAPPSFKIIQPAGAVAAFPDDPFGKADRTGWAQETSLDVEWAHVMAPKANLLLVETPQSETEGVQGFPEIVRAENFVINHNLGDVISQSFGATEETFPSRSSILRLRSAFINARAHRVTVLGSSGDAGATDLLADTSCCFPFRVNSWPSADPLVTSLGGTLLNLDDAGNRLSADVAWSGSGGGPSHVFTRPGFQSDVRSVVGGRRGTPDVSMSAAPRGGVDVFYSFDDWTRVDPTTHQPPFKGPAWHIFGGTSESSPLFAGIVALADQAAGRRLGFLNDRLYEMSGDSAESGIVDVTQGNNSLTFCSASCGTPQEVDTTVAGFDATPGYDLVTGVGTVDAARFVTALARRGEDDRPNADA